MAPRLSFAIAALAALSLAACAETHAGRYPSLLPRAIESLSDAEPEPVVAEAQPDPALDARAATAQATIARNRSEFAAAVTRAEKAVASARGKPAGSDAWISAQVALADLDALRADASAVVSDLDRTVLNRGADGAPPYPALDAAKEAAAAQLQLESERIGALQAQLPAG